MIQFNNKSTIKIVISVVGLTALFAVSAMAQYGSGGGGTGGGGASGGTGGSAAGGGYGAGPTYNFNGNYHVGFDRPEAWGLKYFTSTTLLSGLQPAEPGEGQQRIGPITVGLEVGWLPTLDAGKGESASMVRRQRTSTRHLYS